MADIVNLNRARKARAKDAAAREAETNRVRFGRTRAERSAARKATEAAGRGLDGHRLAPADGRHHGADDGRSGDPGSTD